MERITKSVKMANIFSYETATYTGYGTETRYIYKMTDDEGRVYVWKTTAFMALKIEDPEGWEIDAKGRKWSYDPINRGDVVTITASIKGTGSYKGEEQTELTRVKVNERTFKAQTREEWIAKKKADQTESLKGEDFIWKRMPYKQYKEHYSDCETIYDSFCRDNYTHEAFVDVIIREGRLKKSGVRGEVFSEYTVVSDSGFFVTYKAVCEENAIRRAEKEYPNETGWICEDPEPKQPYEPWGSHSFWSN